MANLHEKNAAVTERKAQESLARQAQVGKILLDMPVHEAIGVACSFLLHCALNHRQMFRAVINEKVHREGFSGISLLDLFNRVGK